jgi:hypothetical protein
MKKILFIIIIAILLSVLFWANNNNWTLKQYLNDDNSINYTLNYSPNRGGVLFYQLFKIDQPFAIRIILQSDEEPLQHELQSYYTKEFPKELKIALASSLNLHNPTLNPLIKAFPSAFRTTTFYKELEKELEKRGFSIASKITFEKFGVYKEKNRYTFYADIWLHTLQLEEMVKTAQIVFPHYSKEALTTFLKNGAWSYDNDAVVITLNQKIYLFMKNSSGKATPRE